MTVTINGTYAVVVAAGASETIVEFLTDKPPMPWTVVVTGSAGAEVGTLSSTGPVDQRVTVSNGELSAEPYDIREDDC